MTAPAKPISELVGIKYPSEDEVYIRRLGSAVLLHWNEIPEEVRGKIQTDAGLVWDREFHIPQLPRKLEAFIKKHLARQH